MSRELNYGNWIRKKTLWRLGLSALVLGVIALLPIQPVIRVVTGILCIFMLVSLAFPLYAYYRFSPLGGNLQERVYSLIVRILGDQGRGSILDIGTGNGVLAIRLALHNPRSRVTAVDYWGKEWEYAMRVCESNARIADVASSIEFVKGDAAALDFPDASFDAVVSNLTFHEVRSVQDKREVVREALRVLKADGSFVFIDYFYAGRHYGPTPELEAFLHGLGLQQVTLQPLGDIMEVPLMLRHPRALGKVGFLSGRK
jgi:SAM-dependent methyltransferase